MTRRSLGRCELYADLFGTDGDELKARNFQTFMIDEVMYPDDSFGRVLGFYGWSIPNDLGELAELGGWLS